MSIHPLFFLGTIPFLSLISLFLLFVVLILILFLRIFIIYNRLFSPRQLLLCLVFIVLLLLIVIFILNLLIELFLITSNYVLFLLPVVSLRSAMLNQDVRGLSFLRLLSRGVMFVRELKFGFTTMRGTAELARGVDQIWVI